MNLLKRQVPTLPTELIQAACDLYGLSPQHIASIQAEQLSTLSPFLWVITLNDRQSAIVVSVPGDMPDGSPHVSPVWVDYDGQYILINTAKGGAKR
jgi:hypothetical protein